MNAPKYALAEIERRWLVDLARVGPLAQLPCRQIDDRYLAGTRLRLRCVEADGQRLLKLCKKYGKRADGAEPITNLYLAPAEYDALAQLPAHAVRKHRYALAGGALDVYVAPAGLAIFEQEFGSVAEAEAYLPPAFAGVEVTHDPRYTGAALAGLSCSDVEAGSPGSLTTGE